MKRYRPDEEISTLQTVLFEHMTSFELKKLAALTKEKLPARKADLAGVIIRYLEGERLRLVWQCLDELQKAAVAEVVHSTSPRFLADRFRAKYGQGPNWGERDKNGHHLSLSLLNFFFYLRGIMPEDLKKRLREFVPPPAEDKIAAVHQTPDTYDLAYERWNEQTKTYFKGVEKVPLMVRETERVAQQELISVLRLVDAGKVAVSDKTRKASPAAMDAVTAILEGGDYYPYDPAKKKSKWYDENPGPIRAFAWPFLIQAGGLAHLSGTRLQLTKAGRKALSEPAAETILTVWTKWVGTTILDELSRIECVKGQTGKGKRGLTAVSSRRSAVAEVLAECPAGEWVSTGEFFRFMRAADNGFTVTQYAWNLYIGELRYGSLGHDGGKRILEERYLLSLLLEYAATLGLIDVALIPPKGARDDYSSVWGTDDLPFFSRYDGLMYFRLTLLGAYCLGMESGYRPAPVEVKPVLRILPNLEIAAIGAALEQSDRLALEAYAVRVSDLVWRLEADKLLTVIEAGRSMAEIREFLAARSSTPVPDTVLRLFEDMTERSTKVFDRGAARIIECADPALAALIANDACTRKHCMRAGERHLVVTTAAESAFRRSLRELGYLASKHPGKDSAP